MIVRVWGWREIDGTVEQVVRTPEGWGVYLCNPEAFHLRDFKTQAEALDWAEALARHVYQGEPLYFHHGGTLGSFGRLD